MPLIPVSGAMAAGNCVIIKPSEVAPASSKLMEELVPRYLDQVFSINYLNSDDLNNKSSLKIERNVIKW